MNKQDWGLVDNLIFEMFKDKIVINAEKFRYLIQRDYGFIPSSALYRRIINYQVKKYGTQLDEHLVATTKYFSQYVYKSRKWNIEKSNARAKLKGIMRRSEKK